MCSNDELLAAVMEIANGQPERWTLPATFSAKPGDTKRHALLERDGEVIAVCSAGGDGPRLLATRDDRELPCVDELVELLRLFGDPRAYVLSCDNEAAAREANDRLGGKTLVVEMPLRLYRFDTSSDRTCAIDPDVRVASEEDLELLARWFHSFGAETGLGTPDDSVLEAEQAIKRGSIRLLEVDGELVALGQRSLEPAAGQVRIGLIFVPQEHRRKGYAGRLVDSLTAEVLQLGAVPCLFTDAANDGTDALYRSLGYDAVEELVHLSPEA